MSCECKDASRKAKSRAERISECAQERAQCDEAMGRGGAVKTLTTAVDGVDVCLAKDIDDPDSHLKLPKGTHTIEGEDALAYAKERMQFDKPLAGASVGSV